MNAERLVSKMLTYAYRGNWAALSILAAGCAPSVGPNQVAVRFYAPAWRPAQMESLDESRCKGEAAGHPRLLVECMQALGYQAEIVGSGGRHLTVDQLPGPTRAIAQSETQPAAGQGTRHYFSDRIASKPFTDDDAVRLWTSSPSERRPADSSERKRALMGLPVALGCAFKMQSFSGTAEYDRAVDACIRKEGPGFVAKMEAGQNAERARLRQQYGLTPTE